MPKLSDVIIHLIKSELKQGVNANRAYDLEVALDMITESEQPSQVASQNIETVVTKKKEKSDV